MTSPLVAVSHDTQIPYVEFQAQAVVTFAMVDKVHCKADGNARKRFDENRRHFTEGEDFFRVDFSHMSAFRTYGISIPPRGIIVLTESGYLLLVKSFTDDLAWQVQKQLIKVYFRAKAQAAAPAPAPEPEPAYEKITHAQVAELSRAINHAFHGWLFNAEAPLHGHNAVRTTFNLRTLADLPAADFERAVALVAWFDRAAVEFRDAVVDLRRRFLVEIIGDRAPWTPALLRKMTAEAMAALPARPDWRAIEEQLKLAKAAGGAA